MVHYVKLRGQEEEYGMQVKMVQIPEYIVNEYFKHILKSEKNYLIPLK